MSSGEPNMAQEFAAVVIDADVQRQLDAMTDEQVLEVSSRVGADIAVNTECRVSGRRPRPDWKLTSELGLHIAAYMSRRLLAMRGSMN